MKRPFRTYNQQLKILRGRNLIISNGSKAISILKREGYYNIINGYKEIFLDSNITKQRLDDWYKNGTRFEHIVALYDFDRELRSILLKYILEVEKYLKTTVSYHFSSKHRDIFNYLNMNNFDDTNIEEVAKLIYNLSGVIKNNSGKKNQDAPIYHYLSEHQELPLWVLVTKMSFGNIVNFYHNMKPVDKLIVVKTIVSAYEKCYRVSLGMPITQQVEILPRMLTFINVFRNICAHEERLFNVVHTNRSKNKLPLTHFHQANQLTFSARVIDCVIILGLFISKKDYKNMISAIKKEIDVLGGKVPAPTKNLILSKMGFAPAWENSVKLI